MAAYHRRRGGKTAAARRPLFCRIGQSACFGFASGNDRSFHCRCAFDSVRRTASAGSGSPAPEPAQHAFAAFQRQLTLNDEARALLWQAIVRRKIENQADCLRLAGVKHEKYEEIQALADKVEPGDVRNVEATAARKYFTALFGCTFTRADDDVTNAALNYGYAILRSSVAKTLAGYGFNCVLGLHHKSPTNPFNLADDLMEPLRPLVDLLVDTMCDELFEKLTAENRRELVSLVNLPVRFDGKTMRARYAIDRTVASLTTFLSTGSLDAFKLPTLLKIDRYYRDEQDD